MRLFLALALAGALNAGAAACPSPAQAVPATLGQPPSWMIPLTVKAIARVFEFVEWIEEDLRAQVDRRREYDPPPVLVPAIDGVHSGGSTSAEPAHAQRGGMIP